MVERTTRCHDLRGKVDFGILTIREDEMEAVLQRFPAEFTISSEQGHREYNLGEVGIPGSAERYLIATTRCLDPGNIEAQATASDMLRDLAPQWLLVVGIGGAVPDEECALGDVVVSSRIYDLTVSAISRGRNEEFSIAGGTIHPAAGAKVANLPAIRDQLGSWHDEASIGRPRPSVKIESDRLLGDVAWNKKVIAALSPLTEGRRPHPVAKVGHIAASDTLIKDIHRPKQWLKVARKIQAFEMESAGVYRAAKSWRPEVPVVAIRGLSDVVGFKREGEWTAYACHTAAAFALAFVRSRPIEPRSSAECERHGDAAPPSAGGTPSP
ncbi:hypothetical protein BE11_15265 [Sorangium cellulosum]|nr:hypothetical protein BE11_15265 [Sorangium cellulosum]